jgi:TRAP-type C4-dicarboxylate transport system permease small subunit
MTGPENHGKLRLALDGILLPTLAAARGAAAVAVILCSLLATIDTLGLWLLRRPVPSVVEISQLLLIVIVFLGLGSAERGRDHITVDLVRDALPNRARQIGDVIVQIISMLVYFTLFAAGMASAIRSWNVQEVPEGLETLPAYPFRFILVIGALLATIAALSVALRPHLNRPSSDSAGD